MHVELLLKDFFLGVGASGLEGVKTLNLNYSFILFMIRNPLLT